MFMELFLIGSFWFWAIIVVESLWLLRCLHDESGPGIGGSLVLLSLVLWLFGDFNVFSEIWHNPVLVSNSLVVYLVMGAIWSMFKFKLLCTDARDELEDAKIKFKENMQITGDIPAEMREKWREYAGNKLQPLRYSQTLLSINDIIPKPRDNKARIMYWLGYWPLSMLWFFFHDMIERIVQRVYQYLVKIYDSIARNTFAGVPDEFGEIKEDKKNER